MAAPLQIRITGLESTFASLKTNVEKIKKEIDNEMAASVELMATVSKSIYTSSNTEIRGSIRAEKLAPFKYELAAGYGSDPMAAYIEFGTGRFFAQYPGKEKEWQDLASEYFVNGKGFMRPAPYFYRSVKSVTVSLLSNITQILKRNERL
jgi:hypothetical protein